MSQHLPYRDGYSDTYNSPPQDSPAVGRTSPLSPGNTQDSQSSQSDTGYRSHRKPAPSPLQTSISANPYSTPTKVLFSNRLRNSPPMVETERYTSQRVDEPRSPKERLDDLLASERSFYDSEDPKFSGNRYKTEQNTRPLKAPSRSVSDPVITARLGGRPSTVTPPLMAPVPEHRATTARGIPRTSSIDSAISSISTSSHSYKASQDSQTRGESPDIGNLIQAAGSSEAVIQHLLKEKQSQTAQNTQLWRLVDKQRAMILGLNKDLERALKDKERYRKKMKESLQAIAAGDPNKGPAVGNAREKSSPSPQSAGGSNGANVGALVSAGLRDVNEDPDELQHSPIDVALAPFPTTPPANLAGTQTRSLSISPDADHKMPEPSPRALNNFNAEARSPGFESGQRQRKNAEVVRELPYNVSVPPSRSLPVGPLHITDSKGDSSSTRVPPAVNMSPTMEQGRANHPPPRKPPPTPLNLGKQPNASSHLHQADSADELDSDYDDMLEVEEIPVFSERGRRKTREEDDKERDLAASRDAEARSLSKKSKSRPSTSTNQKPPVEEPVPAIRQTVKINPPDMQSRHLSPPDSHAGSLAGILSSPGGPNTPSGTINRTFVPRPPMSPGLPSSPRPMGSMNSPLPRNPREGGTQSSSIMPPPMSARGMGAFPGMPLSPRAPRQPIPLPPNTPMSTSSPGMSKFGKLEMVPPPRSLQTSKLGVEDQELSKEMLPNTQGSGEVGEVFRGFVTEEYPDLLLPPNALPSIDVRVASSRLKPSRASMMFPTKTDEDPVFTLAVFARSSGQELWRVEKDSMSLNQIDQELKRSALFTSIKIPEKSLFSGHAPAKIDARRAALDKYLDDILNTPMDTAAAQHICRYLSTNVLEPHARDSVGSNDANDESPTKTGPGGRPLKNGYLTKRGKNFGGWKARFFVLDGPILKYYEAPGGAHLGAIKLQSSKIGKQQQHQQDSQSDDADNQYRHAFLILEPKRKDSSSLVRHVLCAESDQERDEWVEALVQYIESQDSDDESSADVNHCRNDSGTSSHATGAGAKKKVFGQGKPLNIPEQDEDLRSMPYEATVPGQVPRVVNQRKHDSGTPSPPVYGNDRLTPSPPSHGNEKDSMGQLPHSQSGMSISAPKNAIIIQDGSSWGNKQSSLAPVDDKKNQKKRSFFGFGSKPRPSSELQDHNGTSSLSQMSYEQHGPIRAVFGAPLAEAVKYNHPVDVNVELPAVVYRCIEYLDEKNAPGEEGIFRLSGSNVVIKALRERFNTEGDVNLITDDQYYDMHAVASLLKLYLRELPTTILTRELHLDFLGVTEIHDVEDKVVALNRLVHKLPKANNTLLRCLSGFLINIINHSDVNKMTVRNMGIVFSPTLNIPAPVLALFLQQYEGIFESEPQQQQHGPVEVTITAPLTPEDIRSPRRQQFQELPTPSYNQSTFPRGPPPSFPLPAQPNRAAYDTGFTPVQPSYEGQFGQPTMGGPEYGVAAPTLAGPAYDQFSQGNAPYKQPSIENVLTPNGPKSKRRESSMFGMGSAQKKASQDRLQNDRLVDDEAFFD